ncbi:hypothetical protein AAS23_gp74 [Pantoea phage vB_PagS_AAS23]|uniref:Uncharacterized protein n=1 Tax=Pantoea phage vB_PagS_AAS23 TaxID=2499073 RepID=A0A3S9U7T4_9CAUD|nr:hypothetical protein HOU93_gp74 [Pantoea phage vB_PagS_AAS23]AZS06387.1 hypothetical protein AAS23_gp74 [Pantoea phage vB_PagS_AAS23]
MNEEHKNMLIEKCKSEIRRYSHLVKTFDPNEGEEMEEYQQNIQDWNDIISVNTLALASLTAQPVKQPQTHDAHGFPEPSHIINSRWIDSIREAGYEVQD